MHRDEDGRQCSWRGTPLTTVLLRWHSVYEPESSNKLITGRKEGAGAELPSSQGSRTPQR